MIHKLLVASICLIYHLWNAHGELKLDKSIDMKFNQVSKRDQGKKRLQGSWEEAPPPLPPHPVENALVIER